MAEKKNNQEAGFDEGRSAFAGGNSTKGKAIAGNTGQGRHSAHQPRDADAASGYHENNSKEQNGMKPKDRTGDKSSSGDKAGESNTEIKRKHRQQYREKDGSKQSEVKADASRAQASFSQEQSQFAENAGEEQGGGTEDIKDGHSRRDSGNARAKGHYHRRRGRKYQGRVRQSGERQNREPQGSADQEKTEKNEEQKEKAETGKDFQSKDSAFSEGTENVFVGSNKLNRMQKKAEKAGRRTERARKKLPTRREYSLERVFDEKEGKSKYVLMVAKKEKPFKPDSKVKAAAQKAVREPVNYAHRKIAEVEKENSAVEGAHKAEQKAGDLFRSVRRHHKNKVRRRYKKAAKLEKKQFKKEVSFRYQKFLEENPEMSEKTLKRQLQKRIQKHRIKREYARAKRTGQAANNTKEAVFKTTEHTVAVARKLQEAAATHASLLVSAGVLAFLLIMIITSVSSCGALFSDGVSSTLAGAYMSVPAEIDAAELAFSRLEMELQKEVDSIETDYPGYDECHYSIDAIGHDPFVLISYLSAVHTEFTAAGVQGEIEILFDEMYDLALTPTQETRTRTVTKTGTRTVTDPVTGLATEEEYEYEEEEEYTVTILEVTLASAGLGAVVSGHMDGEQYSAYAFYNDTCGLVQQFYSPLDLSWHSLVSSHYGYRIHPISGTEQLHRGVDIAVPTGTAVYAAMDGTVTTAAYSSSYGNYVVIEDSDGYCTKYAHMDSLGVSAGQTVRHGDEIGRSGNTGNSTGSHLHIECMYNGEYYNPLFYFSEQ